MPDLTTFPRRRPWLVASMVIVAAAFAIRVAQFGNPLIDVDEHFYLLVGDRMLHGALPYVDIWDRKPIGLFLIYAAIRLLGGEGIAQYQIVATLFAAATAIVIARIAARMATLPAAVAAAVLYLLMLGIRGGMGGQAPVFYNLFVAGAALATLRAVLLAAPAPGAVRRLGLVAMLLVGVAMQVKYNALFEGVFFGIVLLGVAWRARPGVGALALDAALWIAAALLPTLLALAYYVAIGQTGAFVYANFLSIGARSAGEAGELVGRLTKTWLALHLPLFCVLLAVLLEAWRAFPQGRATLRFVLAWLGAALFGFAVFGTYFDHYALPLMVPIAVACAPAFACARRRIGTWLAVATLLSGGVAYAVAVRNNQVRHGGRRAAETLLAAIRPRLGHGLYVYEGDPVLYYLSGAPLLTRWPFPFHISFQREAGALGVEPVGELRRILALKPGLVVDTVDADESDENPATRALVRATLAHDYRPVVSVPHRGGATIVYERRDMRSIRDTLRPKSRYRGTN